MEKDQNQHPYSRRNFLKKSGMAVAGAAAMTALGATGTVAAIAANPKKSQKRYGMIIDLQKCVGCGGCMIACKNENNVQEGFAWSFKDTRTVGRFPNVRYEYVPKLCNHCEKAPCVEVCPTSPKAMHKEDGNVTAHSPERCIGCQQCMEACPYTEEGKPSVISFNDGPTHKFWNNKQKLIKGCTESAQEVVSKTKGKGVPYYNPDKERFRKGAGLRTNGIVEKCTFCDHRLKQGKNPYCVDRCPSGARVFGDLNDPNSKVNKILGKYRATRLKEHKGTEPSVYYVRDFNPGVYETIDERHREMSVVND